MAAATVKAQGVLAVSPEPGLRIRRIQSGAGVLLAGLCAGVAAAILLCILGYVAHEGIAAINLPFLLQLPRPVGVTGGGVGNGILGSVITVGIAGLMATPIGVLTGLFLALFGRGTLAESIRFAADVLAGVPSIAIGLFAYTLFVQPFGHFSAFSASVAFAILMLPLIVRTSEQAIRSVPLVTREGAIALGMSTYTATVRVILPAAR